MLAANLANFGRIGVIYRKSIEQALVIFPALMAALITVGGGVPADEGGKLDFKVDLGDPPPCSTGFIPPPVIRSPADTTLRDLPTDLYCKTAQNDPAVVRGARNYPCQEFPGKRAPTIQLCRDPTGYVPIGSNPWRGPPVPVRQHAGHQRPRTSRRPTSSRYIPPRADYDPGPPVVQLPPGVPPGPGPAPQRAVPAARAAERQRAAAARGRSTRRRTRSCRRTAGRRPTRPATGPRRPRPPARSRCPPRRRRRRRAVRPTATYDSKTGVFVDPAGGTGVFAAGTDKVGPAENWVDLMLDPRQA